MDATGNESNGTRGDRFALAYATNKTPVQLSADSDIKTYNQYLEQKPGITIPGGTVLRYVDISPGNTSPMHRTVSLDCGVVLEGQVEAVLDSGEVRLLNRGDIVVQRATQHAWKNASQTEWARMLYVLQEAKPVELKNGKVLGEDYGGMEGVRASAS
ncbi:Putative rmlC-like cupin domain superfamily, rmlC-like jelly roll protein [Septoria linicola]|uniref:RmlC-like cupin domain superfamily, rmlC-like jelly roll protein n=1 Tax=Septoria linicola TaxID=215465 RepID=A0A9Q9EPU1_9PEZI|nr:putative rmlC-like cupin domain superfamily, rmlC-like jelly roll protein [Septoria linicola]USW56868.1 Putative rmlC-like cupin domain superfamily, rmlC-like jelly roll protein [Septoria linicola]